MVSTASLAAMFATLLLSVGLPIGLVVYFYRRYRFSLKALLVGVGVFVVFQIVLRLPLLSFLATQSWFSDLSSSFLFSVVLIGGFTAGLVEECGRYLGFSILLKDKLSWENGLAYGLGHGGIEAIAVVGLAYINNIVLSIMINQGAFDRLIAPALGAEAVLIKNQLTGLPPSLFLAAGAERALTLIIHIALSLMVLYAVKRKKPLFLLTAILLHTVLNAGAVYLHQSVSMWAAELYIAALAAAALYLIVKIKEPLQLHEESDRGAEEAAAR